MARRRELTAVEQRWERCRRTVQQWRASGLSQAAFCRHRGIHVATFSWWKRRLGGGPVGHRPEFLRRGVIEPP